jgi:hypothetical protein
MSEVIPFPLPPSKSQEEKETAEFLALLERIRSSSVKQRVVATSRTPRPQEVTFRTDS